MSDEYDRIIATARLQERVRIAREMNGWLAHSPIAVVAKLDAWIDEVTREAKAATAAESAEMVRCVWCGDPVRKQTAVYDRDEPYHHECFCEMSDDKSERNSACTDGDSE